jgi:hypothetical protein
MRRWLFGALAPLLLALIGGPARAEPAEVDLALVLAVDVSLSMDVEEQRLQREGFVEAFRSPLVHQAIGSGLLGRIAVVYLEWAGVHHQEVVVPWTVVGGPSEAAAFADRLGRTPPGRATWTSVSGALDAGTFLLAQSGVEATRRVIDVSGDGANNQGRPVTIARDEAVAKGITVNGLPLMLQRPTGAWDIENLDSYYRDCVIGGPGAFLIPVREREQFAEAIRAKLVREIAGTGEAVRHADGGPIRLAQGAPPTNCLAGEQRTRRRDF